MNKMSLSKRITLFVMAALLLCTAVVGISAYMLERSEVTKAHALRALAITQTIGAALEPGMFEEVMDTLEPTEEYERFGAFLDQSMAGTGAIYLYVLDNDYDTEVTYFAEGYVEGGDDEEERILLGDTDDVEYYPEEMFETLRTGAETVTETYNLGGYGDMVSAYTPVLDAGGRVLGVIGVDLPVNEAIASANRFGLWMTMIILGMCVLTALLVVWYIQTSVGNPIREMTSAAERLAAGDIHIAVTKRREDEIGRLADAFTRMIASMSEQASVIERLAGGDLTVDARSRGDKDAVNQALQRMTSELNEVMSELYESVKQVSIGSKQVADDSQSVAQGSTQQAAAVEQLSAGVRILSDSIAQNAAQAEQATKLTEQVTQRAQAGNAQMARMLDAVREIKAASADIEKVMKVIDDIAFQTNILALNAAVEAARAGAHGKGFAVVAEEVRNLAGKSAEAAKNTEGLIVSSMEKADLGARIAEETSASFRGIVDGIHQSAGIVTEIARAGSEQVLSIQEIDKGISQVSEVVQQNSAAAEQSAAASTQMSGQADMLGELVAQFTLREEKPALGTRKNALPPN